jgi:tryptophan synthase alpha chain
VLYTYMNPIFQFGFEKFHHEAKSCGVDGLLILDLPPEEELVESDLIHVRLIAPTTAPERIAEITRDARGFLYYVSREGVTGTQDSVADSLGPQVEQIRKLSSLPIAVGFGISTAAQARAVAEQAEAVVVGSAIVKEIAAAGQQPDLVQRVIGTVEPLIQAIRSVSG